MEGKTVLKEQYHAWVQAEKTLLWNIYNRLVKIGVLPEETTHVREAIDRLEDLFLLVVVGEFNSGKSAFINTLLEQKILEEGPTPTTDLINILKYGEESRSRVVDNLRLTHFPLELLKNVNIVDTPGTNSIIREHDELTMNFIPQSDFVVFVISVDRPLTDSEREFLELISHKWKRKILFLLNKIDTKEPEDIDVILTYLHTEGQKILGIDPIVFPVSVKQAFQAKQTKNEDLLQQSRFDEVERYLIQALNEKERIRLKLLNPIYTVQPVCQTAQNSLHEKLTVIAEDMRRLRQVEKQLAYTQEDLKEHSTRFILKVENILLDLRNRAYDFVDDFLQLRNIWDITSKDKAELQFNTLVVKDSSQQIEDVLTEAADWMVKKSMKAWDDTLNYYNQQLNHDLYRDKILGEVGGQFGYDRDKIYKSVIHQARDRIKTFDYQQESRKILKTFQNAMIHFAAAEVGAIGIGAVLVSIFSTLLLDITGVLASGALVTAGFFILPRKRRQAKEAFNTSIQELIADLKQHIAHEFDEYMQATFEQIKETTSPVDRFCRAEHDELNTALTELTTFSQQLATLQREITHALTASNENL
ncbi:dynamin family protein [Candidatus Vecturithrix granuli]|uniref:Dynamin family protein n=1 Tax=Vecturithrix granuli TaxID=1499967 RepID=A0A081BZC9_VECG1|nr:dynamin family protein [Candidatus Vecturithrix granuli]